MLLSGIEIERFINVFINYLSKVINIPQEEVKYNPTINIENIVFTVDANKELDLYSIERSLPDIEYDPDMFPGVVLRIDEPHLTALIFRSGKMVVTGAKNMQDVIEGAKRIIKTLKKYGIMIDEKPKVQIQNIVASVNLHVGINIEKVAFLLENTMYEPEQFPGLIYKMNDPMIVMLLFASGKMVVAGARREEYIPIAVKKVFDKLVENECIYPLEEEEVEL